MFSQADQLIVLTDDLGGALGEVEREGCLIRSEIVDVENKLFREVFSRTPNDPPYSWIDKTVPSQN